MFTITLTSPNGPAVYRARHVSTEGSTANFRVLVLTDGTDAAGYSFKALSLLPGVGSDVEVKE